MNICIIGTNLTSLILSKLLINNGLLVSIFSFNDNKYNLSSRTIGISRDNINFINNKIINLKKKNLCKIKNIKIYTDDRKEILNFKNKTDNLFSIIELNKFYKFQKEIKSLSNEYQIWSEYLFKGSLIKFYFYC